MIVSEGPLDGLKIIKRDVYSDNRGWFSELYNKEIYDFLPEFKQDNVSKSGINVLRGLHYQETQPQGKLVTVIEGHVFDVAVNIDITHKEYGKHFGLILKPGMSFYIPDFYAHGFYCLDESIFSYKCTDVFKSGDSRTIAWNSCGIQWPIEEEYIKYKPFLSDADKDAETFMEYTARKIQK
jgi:dTDP-4-dehydrorhamnose 3,5-epimerase